MTTAPTTNIRPAERGKLTWNSDDVPGSLNAVAAYADDVANTAIAWYWQHKKWKAKLSGGIQFTALVATALAGLVPIVAQLAPGVAPLIGGNTGLASSVLVGLAAALIGVDRAFGLSSGWARYVLTATTIRKALQEFRMDWTLLLAKAGPQPSKEDILALVARAKEFSSFVEGLVLQETREWVTEFQTNIAQLEKETKSQLDTRKTEVEKAEVDRAEAGQPGSVEISVVNAEKAENATFQVLWEDEQGKIAQDTVANAKEWVRISVPPGQYAATVSATAGGKPTARKSVVVVQPGEHKKVDVTLPI